MSEVKFSHETEIGQKVYYIQINIRNEDGGRLVSDTFRKQGIIVEEMSIVHQTRRKIVLNDEFVTLLDRKEEGKRRDSYNHFLGDINVSFITKETYFPNGIFASCYTIEAPEKAVKKVKSELISRVKKEYGFLQNISIQIEQLPVFRLLTQPE